MNLANLSDTTRPTRAAQPDAPRAADRAADTQPGVVGDFLFGLGDAADYVAGKAAMFDRLQHAGQAALASSGAVRVTAHDGALHCLLADLVAGDPRNPDPSSWRGRFVSLRLDPAASSVDVAVDQFATLPLYYLARGGSLLLATDLRHLLDCPWVQREADPLAIYHLLNFGFIPAPHTIVGAVRRVQPATRLAFADGRMEIRRYWRPPYAEDLDGDEDNLAEQLRERIVATVQRYRPDGDAGWGCFLSGGTDSSSITSILARQDPQRTVHGFSIGFAEAGYDELDFARIAARACGAQSHAREVGRDDTLALLPTLIDLCDQPFGNASTIPSYSCAQLAADSGVSMLLAGDGGDEIFGGNERYGKDHWLGTFHSLPRPLRAIGEAMGRIAGHGHSRLLQRVANFAERGALPNPDRFYTDESFASEYYDALLAPAFAARVPRDASLDFLRESYADCRARSELHRLMCLDLDFAIAQCDLVKVHGASRAAGVSVRYPYLDVDLVEFTGRLAAHWKVRGSRKRVLFKRAMADVLPRAILEKRKQGFGLPVAVWLTHDAKFRELTRDTLLGERARSRGWLRPAQIEKLLREHDAGSWDWSGEIWRLLALELWMEHYLDR
jgi:asparagine synthase (glutamine-hydrolysing)